MTRAAILFALALLAAAPVRAQDVVATLDPLRGPAPTESAPIEPAVATVSHAPSLPAVPPPPPIAHVQLLGGAAESIRFSVAGVRVVGRRASARRFTRLCASPCSTDLTPGSATFLLERPGADGQTVPPVLLPPGDTTLVAHYESHGDTRAAIAGAGVALLAGGLGAAVGSLLVTDSGASLALLVGSIALTVIGSIVFALIDLASDEAELEVTHPPPSAAVPLELDAAR